ncbi:MAG TPA: M12 family metallo-peptidase, partial [Chitinophagaceae bacterium]|nr:M12 family metallo-peptidase [Chitinophagaceae bacterium]
MRKFYKAYLLLAIMMISVLSSSAQNNFFADAGSNRVVSTTGQRVLFPDQFRTYSVNVIGLKQFLWSLPSENNFIYNRSAAPVISLPMPNGSIARFKVWESSVQEPGLSAKFPEIRTFAGQGIDDPAATIRFDFNPYFGFSAQILSPQGRVFIDPFARYDVNTCMSYYARDFHSTSPFSCTFDELPANTRNNIQESVNAGPCLGTQLRTYRLAFTVTGEFAIAVGGGAAGPTHAAIVTGVNRLTQVYEAELAVRLVLIANNNLIEFLNPATDPWANDGASDLNIITARINTALNGAAGNGAGYDIGHLGCTASDAGVAFLGVVCGSNKGGGLTGGLNPVGDPYYIDYVAHEMGHQFNGSHTFNSNQCASAGGSYEPGGGTTIMAYAGICGAAENIQPNSDPIFHAISFDQIGNFISTGGGAGCAVITPTGNTLPVITSTTANNFSIPINTPFVLDATATDADGDAITYNWEGWDIGAAGTWPTAAASTTRPLFRTRISKTTGQRVFPDMRVIVANYPGTGAPSQMDGLRGEVLPTVARVMKFRLTVRDNRLGGAGVTSSGEGCQSSPTFQVNAVGTTPFAVTSPNGGESWAGGSTQNITWNAAGTTAAPFGVANVKISLSTDGGLTYPTVIVASTPNDGSESLAIPNTPSTTARVKIEAIGNIFFDISNANFTITAPPNGFTFNSPAAVTAACPAPNVMTSGNLTATYFGS